MLPAFKATSASFAFAAPKIHLMSRQTVHTSGHTLAYVGAESFAHAQAGSPIECFGDSSVQLGAAPAAKIHVRRHFDSHQGFSFFVVPLVQTKSAVAVRQIEATDRAPALRTRRFWQKPALDRAFI